MQAVTGLPPGRWLPAATAARNIPPTAGAGRGRYTPRKGNGVGRNGYVPAGREGVNEFDRVSDEIILVVFMALPSPDDCIGQLASLHDQLSVR